MKFKSMVSLRALSAPISFHRFLKAAMAVCDTWESWYPDFPGISLKVRLLMGQDFELAFWQLTYLVVAPRRVYKQTYHQYVHAQERIAGELLMGVVSRRRTSGLETSERACAIDLAEYVVD
jgi:hypothetical protein